MERKPVAGTGTEAPSIVTPTTTPALPVTPHLASVGDAGSNDEQWSWLPSIRVVAAVLLLLGCGYAVLFCSTTRDISGHARGTDDAYISYRYARNMVRGYGPVFNPGDRVEGYSNPLYVALMCIPFVVGVDAYSFSTILNSLCALATLLILVAHLKATLGDRAAALGGLFFALSASIWNWVGSGLETPLVLLLQVSTWVLTERTVARSSRRDLILLCGVIGALVLTRADGFVTAFIAGSYLFFRQRKAAIVVGVTAVAVFGALLAWRLSYYHDVWPNTVYAKVTSSLSARLKSAFKELGGVGARQGLLPYFAAGALCLVQWLQALRRDGKAAFGQLSFALYFSVAWLSYWLCVGGDNFEDRFLIIIVPLGCYLLLANILAGAPAKVRSFVVIMTVASQLAVVVREDQYSKTLGHRYDRWITLGKFLAEKRPGQLLATAAAGKIPFFSDLATIDMLGLNDKHIGKLQPKSFVVGHSKFDADYVLARHPDLVAGVLDGNGLDLGLGLDREKYLSAGYKIRFMLNATPWSMGDKDILDVLGRPESEVLCFARSGWGEVVLERSAASR